MLLPVAQHAVLESEATSAEVAGEGPLAGVSAHVTAQVFGRPETADAESAYHLIIGQIELELAIFVGSQLSILL